MDFFQELVEQVVGLDPFAQYGLVFVALVLAGCGIPLSEDLILFSAGLLAWANEDTRVLVMIGVCLAGVVGGDSVMFWLGLRFGGALLGVWPFRKLISTERFLKLRDRFQRHGNKYIAAARFTPAFRSVVFFSAGTLHVPYRVFLLYDFLAALIEVPLLLGLIHYFGETIVETLKEYRRVIAVIVVAGFVLVLLRFR